MKSTIIKQNTNFIGGFYKIEFIYDVSNSLLNQSNAETAAGVKKALLRNMKTSEEFIFYFIDENELGEKSEINLKKCESFPLIKNEDYDLIKLVKYEKNNNFINEMLEKKRKKINE
ncbi:hypothetical protein NUSPORA_00470 [Nucleospora cyclopteri]